jgi:tetratricopeptide (TPR) repeat protein
MNISPTKKLKLMETYELENGVSSETLLEKATLLISLGEFEKAKSFLYLCLEENKNILIIKKLIICWKELNLNVEAANTLENNLKHFQKTSFYWIMLALFKYEIKDYNVAFGASLQAITAYKLFSPEIWKVFAGSVLMFKKQNIGHTISKDFLAQGYENEYIIECYINSCLQLGFYNEAIKFLDETKFPFQNFPILLGIAANIYGKRSAEAEKALSMNEKATLLEPNNIRFRWNLALAQLKNGKIKEGIKNYEARLEWREFPSPKRKFVLPKKWHPNIDPQSKIMLWWEQGIGDQIRFWSALPLFQKEFPNLVLEPSAKTYEIISSSFPDLHVRYGNLNVDDLTSYEEDFDFHLPIGTMFHYIISKHVHELEQHDFTLNLKYLKPDKLRKLFWKDKLADLSNKPKIGFCWRSKNNKGQRKKEYTELEHWNTLFKKSEYEFVNLQYDLSHEAFEKQFPDTAKYFLNTGHLDQMDDLEGALALISNLDLVITASSAPCSIASASGVNTIIYSSPHLFTYGRWEKFAMCPFFANARNYLTDDPSNDPDLVKDITKQIVNFLN